MRMAVDESGHEEMTAAVDAVITVEADTDIDDPVALDNDIGDARCTGTHVEDDSAAEQGSRHGLQHRTTRSVSSRSDGAPRWPTR